MTPQFIDPLARMDLNLLYPPFRERLILMFQGLQVVGADFRAIEGFRTMQRAAALFEQGRGGIPGRRVTNAKPEYCPHVYGLALDLGRYFGGTISWDSRDYEVLGTEAVAAGLVWGGSFLHLHDADHVQWPGFVTAEQLQPLKDIYDARKTNAGDAWLQEVWAEVTATSDTQPHIPLPSPIKPEVS